MQKFIGNWATQVRKGILELSILNAVRSERLYGYALVRKLETIPGLVVSEGTIYPLLSRLEREGWVDSSLEPSPDGPARKYYRLTPEGEAVLEEMNRRWSSVVSGLERLRQGEEDGAD